MEQKVRLLSLSIKNMKNVMYGTLTFPKTDEACILGLYGQNGSGKTTAIQALALFKIAASGNPLPKTVSDFITHGKAECVITIDLALTQEKGDFKVRYQCGISKENGDSFSFEELSMDKNKKMQVLFNCSKNDDIDKSFNPQSNLSSIVGEDQRKKEGYIAACATTTERRSSLIFSKEFIDLIERPKNDDFALIVSTINNYAKNYLFTNIDLKDSNQNYISLAPLIPFSIKKRVNERFFKLKIPLDQKEKEVLDIELFSIAKNIVESSISILLSSLVPGLSIKMVECGEETMKDGKEGIKYEVFSERNGEKTPIRYEAQGTKKLISALSFIIASYNNESVCVFLDNLDSGVFELLFGDILEVFSESGDGQLLFTSHNLRPLEVLDKRSIVFTTSNPNNKYVSIKNICPSKNLRDYYLKHPCS